ncbi:MULTISPECIES: HalX domain-containing protein [Aeromonas]|uniref:HalX domain-containing protein n=1 Tax=Aeromonas TaxID=642 RepID=UPI001650BCAE|nr:MULTISPECIES: HalX domain-containing protein [Aeromonas]
MTQVEQTPVVEVKDEVRKGLEELEAKAKSNRFEIQEYQATFAEYNELRADFPALEATIDSVLRHTSQEFQTLRGRLAAVEEVMRTLGEGR